MRSINLLLSGGVETQAHQFRSLTGYRQIMHALWQTPHCALKCSNLAQVKALGIPLGAKSTVETAIVRIELELSGPLEAWLHTNYNRGDIAFG